MNKVVILIPLLLFTVMQINYRQTKSYGTYELNMEVNEWVKAEMKVREVKDIEDMCDFTNEIVSRRLLYIYSASIRNPNEAWQERQADCLEYAALQAAVLNYIIKLLGENSWHAYQFSGKVYIGEFWLASVSSILGYHSYTVIKNTMTGEKHVPDACIYDIAGIGYAAEN